MIEFLQSYGIWIFLGLLLFLMMRRGGHGGCCSGGHEHHDEVTEKDNKDGSAGRGSS